MVTAAAFGDYHATLKLLNERVSIESTGLDGLSPLQAAAKHGHLEIVRLLVSRKASINGPAANERTALFLAVLYGHEDVAKLLLEHGGQLRGTREGNMALLRAVKKNRSPYLLSVVEQELASRWPN